MWAWLAIMPLLGNYTVESSRFSGVAYASEYGSGHTQTLNGTR